MQTIRRLRAGKYALAFVLPLLVVTGLLLGGLWTFVPLLYLYVLLPVLELLLPAPTTNPGEAEEAALSRDPLYDWLLYLAVPVQYGVLVYFLLAVPELHGPALAGAVLAMGLMCGTFGINIGHELGHRAGHGQRLLARLLLLTSLNLHFYIEHNRGHHRRVATPADPASARRGESLYRFWWRSIGGEYRSAWRLEAERLRRRGQSPFGLYNHMVLYQLIQLALLVVIGTLFGPKALLCFVLAALMGILLLETINYIEHYGLCRRQLESGRYERVAPAHSWNSNHLIGRLSLFELSRHSDHHFRASRKYPVLRHHDGSPQMPTGYPGMMLLAAVPVLWFRVMDRRLQQVRQPVT